MAQHAATAQQQHHAPQQQRPDAIAAAATEPLPLRGAPHLQVRGRHGALTAWRACRPTRRFPHSQRRPHGGTTARDAKIQHRQIREYQSGHVAYQPESPRVAVGPQYWSETIRQVRFGAVARNCVRAIIEAEALGQADGKGPGFLQEDARVGL